MSPKLTSRLPFLAVAALLAGCGADPLTLSQTVGPDGATLELPGGFSLVIPAGALESDVELGVELLGDLGDAGYADAPSFFDGAPDVSVALTPHGQTFLQPLTLTLPVVSTATTELALLRVDDEADADWEAVGPITVADGLLTASIDRFSAYSVGAVRAGECPCYTGADIAFLRGVAGGFEGMGDDNVVAGGVMTGKNVVFMAGTRMTVWGPSEVGCNLIAQPPSEWAAHFPNRTPNAPAGGFPGFPDTDWAILVEDTTPEIARACTTLLLMQTEGDAVEVALTVRGLPPGESVTVARTSGGNVVLTENDELVWAGFAAVGDAYEVTIATQPASAVCTLPANASGTAGMENIGVEITCACADGDGDGVTTCGPDATPGTADDDCDDADPARFPGNPEICDGVDNDCDDAVPPGETTDGDGDGVPDACDDSPTVACSRFDLAAAREVAALTGAVCRSGATGVDIPAPIANFYLAEAVEFTGAFTAYNGGAWEAVGAWVDAAGTRHTFRDCDDSGAAPGDCTGMGRDEGWIESDVSQAEYDACKGVAAYACR